MPYAWILPCRVRPSYCTTTRVCCVSEWNLGLEIDKYTIVCHTISGIKKAQIHRTPTNKRRSSMKKYYLVGLAFVLAVAVWGTNLRFEPMSETDSPVPAASQLASASEIGTPDANTNVSEGSRFQFGPVSAEASSRSRYKNHRSRRTYCTVWTWWTSIGYGGFPVRIGCIISSN